MSIAFSTIKHAVYGECVLKIPDRPSYNREKDALQMVGGVPGVVTLVEASNGRLILGKLEGENLQEMLLATPSYGRHSKEHQRHVQRSIFIASSIATSLGFVHLETTAKEPYAWYDVSPCNVYVDADYAVTLLDFGMSFKISAPPDDFRQIVPGSLGTEVCMSPEQYYGKPEEGLASDVFGLGSLLYYMIHYNRAPFSSELGSMDDQFKNPPPPATDSILADLLIKSCWELDPRNRPTIQEVQKELLVLT